jgi:hypothetical protein
LPHSFSGAAESGADRLAELTPISEMADEPRNVVEPPPEVSHARRLLDTEVVGDGVHVQEPKDEQHDGDHADKCERDQDKARDSVGREVSRATWQAPGRCVRRERFCGHPPGYYAACGRRTTNFPPSGGFGERPAKRDDESIEGPKNEGDLYREILRRAKGVREAAAESLRRSHASRKKLEDRAQRRRRFRRQG